MPPTWGPCVRTASGPFVLEDAVPLDEIRAAAAESPSGLLPLLRPIDAGLDALPEIDPDAGGDPAGGPGQFVRPSAGLPEPADLYRLRGPDGVLVAIASRSGTNRLAPDKVFVSPTPAAAATRA